MKLIVKRAHMPYPGVRLVAGLKMVIEPDEIAEALVRRGWFEETSAEVENSEDEIKPNSKSKKEGKK